jgi:hypothetical protein
MSKFSPTEIHNSGQRNMAGKKKALAKKLRSSMPTLLKFLAASMNAGWIHHALKKLRHRMAIRGLTKADIEIGGPLCAKTSTSLTVFDKIPGTNRASWRSKGSLLMRTSRRSLLMALRKLNMSTKVMRMRIQGEPEYQDNANWVKNRKNICEVELGKMTSAKPRCRNLVLNFKRSSALI